MSERGLGAVPKASSSTTWTMITEVVRPPAMLLRMGEDMLYVLAGALEVEPTRLLLWIGIHAPDGVEPADGVRMNFNVAISLDGARLSPDNAAIVEARLRRAAPTLTRVPEGS